MRHLLWVMFVIILSILAYSEVYKMGYKKGYGDSFVEAYNDGADSAFTLVMQKIDTIATKVNDSNKIVKLNMTTRKDTLVCYLSPKYRQ